MAEQNNQQDINQLLKVRREKLAALQEAGKDPFQITKFDQTHHSLEVKELYEAHEAEILKDRKAPDVEGMDEQQAREVLQQDYNERRAIMDADIVISLKYVLLGFTAFCVSAVTCGKKIEMIDDGYFSAEVQLKPGENIFTFKHKDKTVVYKITYEMELIRSVSPTGTVSAPGGSNLDIAVVAHKSSTVTAVINGTSVSLKRSDNYSDDATADDSSDYTYFVGSYVMPEATS